MCLCNEHKKKSTTKEPSKSLKTSTDDFNPKRCQAFILERQQQ